LVRRVRVCDPRDVSLRVQIREPARPRATQAKVRPPAVAVGAAMTPAAVVALQRSAGNHATAQLLQRKFWEQTANQTYVWHDEDPDPTQFDPVLDNSGSPVKYRAPYNFFAWGVYEAIRPQAPAPQLVQPTPPTPSVQQPPPARVPAAGAAKAIVKQEPAQPVPPINEPLDRLLTQVGPSCWLFVVEAIANIKGLDTHRLATALQLYPSGDAAKDLNRLQEADVLIARLQGVRTRIDDRVGPMTWSRLQQLTRRAQVEERRIVPFTHRLLARLQCGAKGYAVADVQGELDRLIAFVMRLRAEIAKPGVHGQDDEAKLLGGARVEIGKGEKLTTFGAVLSDHLTTHGVCMLGISQRFHVHDYDDDPVVHPLGSKDYDFTKVNPHEIKRGGPHAVLLLECDTSNRIVRYKDPNYGDAVITVTLAQIARMAALWGKVEVYPLRRVAVTAPSIESLLDKKKAA
jgi:hypothetical protein